MGGGGWAEICAKRISQVFGFLRGIITRIGGIDLDLEPDSVSRLKLMQFRCRCLEASFKPKPDTSTGGVEDARQRRYECGISYSRFLISAAPRSSRQHEAGVLHCLETQRHDQRPWMIDAE